MALDPKILESLLAVRAYDQQLKIAFRSFLGDVFENIANLHLSAD